MECGPRLATLRPLAPSNDPHGPCGDGDCSPSPDGRGSKRSTFVDDLKIATIPPNSLLELVRTTELSKSRRGAASLPYPVSRAAGRGATPRASIAGLGPALRPGGGEGTTRAGARVALVDRCEDEPPWEAGGARRDVSRRGRCRLVPRGPGGLVPGLECREIRANFQGNP